jgi:hypothetical protein
MSAAVTSDAPGADSGVLLYLAPWLLSLCFALFAAPFECAYINAKNGPLLGTY